MNDFNIYNLLTSEYKDTIFIDEKDEGKYRYVNFIYKNKTECIKNYFELNIIARFDINIINDYKTNQDKYWYLKECIPLMEQMLCKKLSEDKYKERLNNK